VLITRTHTKLAGARAIGARLCSCCTGGPTTATIIYYSRANTIHRRCVLSLSRRRRRRPQIYAMFKNKRAGVCMQPRVCVRTNASSSPARAAAAVLRQQLGPPARSRPTPVIRPSPLGRGRPRRGVDGVRLKARRA